MLPLLPAQAIVISVASLAGGWFVYDRLCKSPIGRNTTLLGVCRLRADRRRGLDALPHVFSGRGALIHVGAFIGTIMAVNVFGVIIPNQQKIVASLLRGRGARPALGAIGKQRSVHNNYLTLPVLLMMVSNHYPMLSGHPQAWLIVALIIVDRRDASAISSTGTMPATRSRDRLDAAGRGGGARASRSA